MNEKEMRDFQKILEDANKDINEILQLHKEFYAREKEIEENLDAKS